MQELSKYRTEIMGSAILWIIFFHVKIDSTIFPLPIRFIKESGYAGVDIFFLLSGYGIAHSLSKTKNVFHFFLKRVIRIIPAFWLIAFLYIVLDFFSNQDVNILQSIVSFLGLDYVIFGRMNVWYIPAIMICYLLSPIFYSFLKKYNGTLSILIITVFLLAISVADIFIAPHLLIFLIRLPVFVFGMYIGLSSIKGKKHVCMKSIILNTFILIVAVCVLALIFLFIDRDYRWEIGLWWYPTIFMSFPICIIISKILETIENSHSSIFLIKGLRFLGSYSLELYLIHCFIFEFANYTHMEGAKWNYARIPEYMSYVAVSLIGAFVLNKLTKRLRI